MLQGERAMKNKALAIGQSLLWCFVILLFPVASGTLSVILSLNSVGTLFLQGAFMLAALIPPAVFVLGGKWRRREIGFGKFDFEGYKRALYFIPLLLIFVPAAVKGFHIKPAGYVLGNLFLYLFVGISEEIYFRGVIPRYLKKEFSTGAVVLLSTLIFGIGHIAAAFSGINGLEIALTVFNAFIFGWLAMEMTLISSNIIPAVLVHFLFDFETKLVAMGSEELLIAEGVRGILMFVLAGWLTIITYKQRHTAQAVEN